VLHELFFAALTGLGTQPTRSGAFMKAVDTSYGNFDAWRRDIARLAQTRGVGWVLTLQSRIDIWEHAYLIDYKPSERAQYIQTLFDNLNWDVIERRCEANEKTVKQ
jgi:Fe-Mn family superoxide dismutase